MSLTDIVYVCVSPVNCDLFVRLSVGIVYVRLSPVNCDLFVRLSVGIV